MIDLEAEIEVIKASETKSEAGEENLSTKPSLSAFDVINYGIFLMNVLVGKRQLIIRIWMKKMKCCLCHMWNFTNQPEKRYGF